MLIDTDKLCCDYCGEILDGDFYYYSFDFKEINVQNMAVSVKDGIFSADVCNDCMESYKQRVKQAYKPPDKDAIYCDISGEKLSGNILYYLCIITRVDVRFSGKLYYCEVCKQNKKVSNIPCEECPENHQLTRNADVKKDEEHFEFNFSKQMYDLFVNHVDIIKKRGIEEWAKI